jgi:hypothetical protein
MHQATGIAMLYIVKQQFILHGILEYLNAALFLARPVIRD